MVEVKSTYFKFFDDTKCVDIVEELSNSLVTRVTEISFSFVVFASYLQQHLA